MILQSLVSCYEELLRSGKLTGENWTDGYKIGFELVLNDKGEIVTVIDKRTEKTIKDKKGKEKTVWVPSPYTVPLRVEPTSGIRANFLCGNTEYMLGIQKNKDFEDKPNENSSEDSSNDSQNESNLKEKKEKIGERFEANKKYHHTLLDDINSVCAKSILAFFDNWDTKNAKDTLKEILLDNNVEWKDFVKSNLVFSYQKLDGTYECSVNDKLIRAAWEKSKSVENDEDGDKLQCLVTGKVSPIAKKHPKIYGLNGASTGAPLVSFNEKSSCFYGKKEGYNAPVSKYAANAYAAALNYMLADKEHCKLIGDTTVVYWAENVEPEYSALYGDLLDGGFSNTELKSVMDALRKGKKIDYHESELQPDQHFYILGLIANKGRLSVKFFNQDTFGNFVKNICDHYKRLEIIRPSYDNQSDNLRESSLSSLVEETKHPKDNDSKQTNQLVGDLFNAVLNGGKYPAILINKILLRIRAEQDIGWRKAAIIKAYFLRNNTNSDMKEVLQVELNENSNYTPYVLGRMFALLELIQKNAINKETIRAGYFNSATSTPAMVFPTLIKLAQYHMNKFEDGKKIWYDTKLTNLMVKIEEFPKVLTLSEQGAFLLGYYHQKQDLYKKNDKEDK